MLQTSRRQTNTSFWQTNCRNSVTTIGTRVEGKKAPIGLILSAGRNDEHVKLIHLEESNIRVAEYMMMLPDKKMLKLKLQKAISYARERMAIQEQE